MKIEEEPQDEQERSISILIPCDLIMDILSRIPARSLMRLRCVSKFWYSLIHDPYFINMHLFHAEKLMPALLVQELPKDSDSIPTMLHLHSLADNPTFDNSRAFATIENKYYRIPSNPCNGMICNNGYSSVDVINLTTQESITILKSTRSMAYWTNDDVYLAFHPSTKEYKLVQMYNADPEQDGTYTFEVLTLGSDSWRLIGDVPVPYKFIFRSDGIYVNDAIYFLANEDEMASPRIIYLDLGDEKFKLLKPAPACFEECLDVQCYNLHAVNGNLCLSHSCKEAAVLSLKPAMDIWMLKDKQCWSKDYGIVEPNTSVDHLRFITIYDRQALLCCRGELWCYHLGNGSSIVFKYDKIDILNLVCTYVETLVSLDKFKPESSSLAPVELEPEEVLQLARGWLPFDDVENWIPICNSTEFPS